MSRAAFAFGALHVLTWVSFFLQFAIDATYTNILACLLVATTSTLTFAYTRAAKCLEDNTLSALAVVGLCVTTQWGALIAQTLFWGSLTENLRVPLFTFASLSAFQMTAVGAHWIARNISLFPRCREFISIYGLAPLGIFSIPAVPAIWAMGLLGLASIFFAGSTEAGLSGKVAGGLSFLTWAPFTIPILSSRLGPNFCNVRRQISLLLIYLVMVILVALALNARQVMFFGILNVMLLYVIQGFTDERPFHWKVLKPVVWVILGIGLIYTPLTYFLTAVEVAREYRSKASPLEMLNETYRATLNSTAVAKAQEAARLKAQIGIYDEYYFQSGLIGRLIETKFHDNSFFMIQGLRANEASMVRESVAEKIIALAPYPVLKWFDLERAKSAISYSVGDYLVFLRYGNSMGFSLGEFKTGSLFAEGLAAFGLWFYVMYLFICIALFIIWDILAVRRIDRIGAVMSLLGMMLVFRVFTYGIAGDSLSALIGLIARNQLQGILLYTIVFVCLTRIWKSFQVNNVASFRVGAKRRDGSANADGDNATVSEGIRART